MTITVETVVVIGLLGLSFLYFDLLRKHDKLETHVSLLQMVLTKGVQHDDSTPPS